MSGIPTQYLDELISMVRVVIPAAMSLEEMSDDKKNEVYRDAGEAATWLGKWIVKKVSPWIMPVRETELQCWNFFMLSLGNLAVSLGIAANDQEHFIRTFATNIGIEFLERKLGRKLQE